jgi:hypothetical protein
MMIKWKTRIWNICVVRTHRCEKSRRWKWWIKITVWKWDTTRVCTKLWAERTCPVFVTAEICKFTTEKTQIAINNTQIHHILIKVTISNKCWTINTPWIETRSTRTINKITKVNPTRMNISQICWRTPKHNCGTLRRSAVNCIDTSPTMGEIANGQIQINKLIKFNGSITTEIAVIKQNRDGGAFNTWDISHGQTYGMLNEEKLTHRAGTVKCTTSQNCNGRAVNRTTSTERRVPRCTTKRKSTIWKGIIHWTTNPMNCPSESTRICERYVKKNAMRDDIAFLVVNYQSRTLYGVWNLRAFTTWIRKE